MDITMRLGLDYTIKIVDWIRIAKNSDPFNTIIQPRRK